MSKTNIWDFNRALTRRLALVNVVNVLVGKRLLREQGIWYGIGTQAVGWGLINIGIAVFGRLSTARRLERLDNPLDEQVMEQERRSLRRILLINTPLNLLYMWGGYRLAQSEKARQDSVMRGNGWGIIIQGAILFVNDLAHTLLISRIRRPQP